MINDESRLGDVIRTGSAMWLGIDERAADFEALGDDLIGCPAAEDPLASGVIGGISAAICNPLAIRLGSSLMAVAEDRGDVVAGADLLQVMVRGCNVPEIRD